MKGYKVFNKDFKCIGFQYEVGKTYEMDSKPQLCSNGFHYCERVQDCFNYYGFDVNNKIAEIEAIGEIDKYNDKCATNKIVIVREITWEEMLRIANTGTGNSGINNSGDSNSGDRNSGNSNSGYRNSGDSNSGYRNSGYSNSGDRNSGDRNSGNSNSGDRNSGDSNSGYRNSGDRNSGYRNSGDSNSGDRNSGDSNSGDRNSGNSNSGNSNSGYYNSGHFNSSDNNSGCFNQETHKIKIFDVDADITLKEFERSEAWNLLRRINFVPTTWICAYDMTDEEKQENPDYKTLGGYLKRNDLSEINQKWWDGLNVAEKNMIKTIPNFNGDKFQQIMKIEL